MESIVSVAKLFGWFGESELASNKCFSCNPSMMLTIIYKKTNPQNIENINIIDTMIRHFHGIRMFEHYELYYWPPLGKNWPNKVTEESL